MEWNQKWALEFTDESKYAVKQYYFNNYAEHWERRPEMKKALGSIPSLMMWDDHVIFGGTGSYLLLLHQSPIMMGLFEIGQQMRLLFQHHTTPEKARKHRLFGYQGYNCLAQCGSHLAPLGADGRSEHNDLQNVAHLIVLFPVPFSFARFKMAESFLETWKQLTLKRRNIPFSEQTNSVFGEHIPLPLNDSKLMYQIISSAIVNRLPHRIVICAAHCFGTKWYPVVDTEEKLIDSFERDPKQGARLFLKRLLPNRNWCYFEQFTVMDSTLNTRVTQTGFFGRFSGLLLIFF
ncbi:unnamed protein product [Rotaria socialis]|uniref:PhoD-like phosphatase domain-containing protein n=1 Tax=Rotaria socialis TaxID=392032 RepID=A0A820ENX2_9BILA|nr:unnamed protein product [Rotaria socialis]